jgi:type I restriction enzyme S subunit
MTQLGNYPARRLKYIATLNDQALPEATDPDFELAYIDIGNVDSRGTVHDIVKYRFKDAPSRARRIVRTGDVIVSTVRTYLQAIAPIENPPHNLIVSTGFAVVRPTASFDPTFCKYALRETRFLWEVESRSTGVSYPAINASDLGDIRIMTPPSDLQCRIGEYLECETVRIDALIAEKERMLELLGEKRAAVVSSAVTRGLDLTTPTKPSGQEWLGDIPAQWEMPRAKSLFREVDIRSETGEETLLSLRMGVGLIPHREVSIKALAPSDVIGFKKVESGQMVINRMRAASGLIAVATEPGLVSPDYAVFDVVDAELSFQYFLQLFKTELLQAVFRSASKGMGTGEQGFLRLYTENFLGLHFPYPPPDEQLQILAYVEKESAEIARMESLLNQSIELATERRAALITAAVTGRISLEEMAR